MSISLELTRCLDETSVNEPGGSGNGPNYLKGFRVEIYKYGEQKIDQEWRKDNGHIGSRYNIQKKGEFTDGTWYLQS
jgi:hypothetical protein